MEISNTVMKRTFLQVPKVPIKGHNQLYLSPNFGEKNLYGSEKNGSLVCHIQSSTTISPTSRTIS